MLSWGTAYISLPTINDIYCTFFIIIYTTLECISDYAHIAMMIERCVVIFFPLRAKGLVNRRFTIILLCVCIIPMWLAYTPTLFFICQVNPDLGSFNGKACGFNQNHVFFMYYYIVEMMILNFIHVIATPILILILVVKVRAHRNRRSHMIQTMANIGTKPVAENNSAFLIMIIISLMNFIFYCPYCFLVILNKYINTDSWSYQLYSIIDNSLNLFMEAICFAQSINFLVYYWRIPSFRTELGKLFRCVNSKWQIKKIVSLWIFKI